MRMLIFTKASEVGAYLRNCQPVLLELALILTINLLVFNCCFKVARREEDDENLSDLFDEIENEHLDSILCLLFVIKLHFELTFVGSL